MIRISHRTRRGLGEAIGIPGVIGGLVLVLLAFSFYFETAA